MTFQPALTNPFSFPALKQSQNMITGTNSEWVKIQPIVKTNTAMNIGNMVAARYAGLPFWGVKPPTAMP